MMRWTKTGPFFLLVFWTKTAFVSANFECGKAAVPAPPNVQFFIQDGSQAQPKLFPWTVVLKSAKYNKACSATILPVRNNKVESDIVLSAARCVHDFQLTRAEGEEGKLTVVSGSIRLINESKLIVIAGTNDADSCDRVLVNVKRYKVYPEYKFNEVETQNHRHDFAVLQLDTPLRFNEFIRPICLPEKDAGQPLDKPCFIAGFGAHRMHGVEYTGKLRFAQVSLSDSSQYRKCRPRNEHKTVWRPCRYDYEIYFTGANRASFPLQGDSGGPVMCLERGDTWVQHSVIGGDDRYGMRDLQRSTSIAYRNHYDWMVARIKQFSAVWQ